MSDEDDPRGGAVFWLVLVLVPLVLFLVFAVMS